MVILKLSESDCLQVLMLRDYIEQQQMLFGWILAGIGTVLMLILAYNLWGFRKIIKWEFKQDTEDIKNKLNDKILITEKECKRYARQINLKHSLSLQFEFYYSIIKLSYENMDLERFFEFSYLYMNLYGEYDNLCYTCNFDVSAGVKKVVDKIKNLIDFIIKYDNFASKEGYTLGGNNEPFELHCIKDIKYYIPKPKTIDIELLDYKIISVLSSKKFEKLCDLVENYYLNATQGNGDKDFYNKMHDIYYHDFKRLKNYGLAEDFCFPEWASSIEP